MVQHVQVNLGWDIENVSRPLQELNRIFSQKKVCVISFLISFFLLDCTILQLEAKESH
jgi:hypothetical protein